MTKRIGARLARLESLRRPAAADLVAEAALYGERVWSVPSARCYAQQTPYAARLAVVCGGSALVYEVPGVDVGDLR